MSIKVKNRCEFEDFAAGCPGTLTTGSLCGIYVVPFPCQLKGVLAALGTAGTACTVDILKNGTTIFASGKIAFGSTTTPTYGTLTNNPTTFVKGDIVKVTCSTITGSPADLGLALNFQRTKASGPSAQTQLGSIGADAEY